METIILFGARSWGWVTDPTLDSVLSSSQSTTAFCSISNVLAWPLLGFSLSLLLIIINRVVLLWYIVVPLCILPLWTCMEVGGSLSIWDSGLMSFSLETYTLEPEGLWQIHKSIWVMHQDNSSIEFSRSLASFSDFSHSPGAIWNQSWQPFKLRSAVYAHNILFKKAGKCIIYF